LQFAQKKTKTELVIPVHPELQRLLDLRPPPAPARSGETHLNFLLTPTGLPFDENYYGWHFRQWIKEAGLPGRCSSHGLRKASMIRLAHLGLSAPAIAAISGHRDLREVQRYIEQASQERLARLAIEALPAYRPAAEAA